MCLQAILWCARVLALELLIAAGVEKLVVFGGAGAIHPPRVKIYDLVVSTWGIREEGTSYHYLPPGVVPKPSEDMVKLLVDALSPVAQRLGIGLHIGGVWTTDAVFRETRDKVESTARKGS
ncbi:phosphorylase [Hyperthermus butylicus]|uniref:Phosphorylase family n=1 Tax=Hyperthermus butylicus (strain DSM 5456 / JCM 9403 / PLM1-5) TaxID=415426 RepID=A2BKK8_HYPBU|nr:phosphorylase [Hyperthermus butylicus]ABM80519.1 phosphorylase family [Hyperthermus butylicus DSM 5456]